MQSRRAYLQVAVFVMVWMGMGWLFHLSTVAYLLLGIPLTVIMQLFVLRRPLPSLWVYDATQLRLNLFGWIGAACFMIVPAQALYTAVGEKVWLRAIYLLAACFGAIGVGFTLQHARRSLVRSALLSFVAATLISVTIMVCVGLFRHVSPIPDASKLPQLLHRFLMYMAVSFVMEEVVFRGLLDPVVWRRSGSLAEYWMSAVFIGALWGLWHLPVFHAKTITGLVVLAPLTILLHVGEGVLISLCWRASGTLLLPAIYHAFVDAYRDSLFR